MAKGISLQEVKKTKFKNFDNKENASPQLPNNFIDPRSSFQGSSNILVTFNGSRNYQTIKKSPKLQSNHSWLAKTGKYTCMQITERVNVKFVLRQIQ